MNGRVFTWLCVFLFMLCIPMSNISAQAPSLGTVAGRILDAKTGEPLVGATIFVVGTTTGSAADLDGKFSCRLAPGVYAIEARSIGYRTKRVEQIKVIAGQQLLLSFSLDENSVEQKEVEIVANIAKNNEGNLLQDQRAAAGVSSGVSAELLSRTPDRTLSESFKRISGASIRDGKFAVVRGLQERYNQGQVNGMAQPSTEPDRKAFSLDLFPTALIDRITVTKTGTPDLPGDFAGGVISIQTMDIPYSNTFSISASAETHSLTTGKTFLRSTVSSTDWLGFDNGTRQLPTGIYTRAQAATDPGLQEEARQTRLQNNNFAPTRDGAAPPNTYFQAFLGRRGTLMGKTVGMVLGLNYYRTLQYNEFLNYNILSDRVDLETGNRFVVGYDSIVQKRYRSAASTSIIANFSIRPDVRSKLAFRNLFVQTGISLYQQGQGVNVEVIGGPKNKRRNYSDFFDENRNTSHQLSYERMLGTGGGKVEALVGATYLNRNTPDFRRLSYANQNQTNNPALDDYQIRVNPVGREYNPGYAGKFLSTLYEESWNGTAALTLPFKLVGLKNSFKTGGMYQWRDRVYNGRNFNYTYSLGYNPDLSLGADSILNPNNIGGGKLRLLETTFPSDFYRASSRLSAGFVMNETNLNTNTRVIYGVRVENYRQHIVGVRLAGQPFNTVSDVVDVLPSINAQIGLAKDLYLRLAYFASVNRPEFRELSPSQFFDPERGVVVWGNDTIVRSRIQNFDAKLEMYPAPGAVISFNAFYKTIDRPIESYRENIANFPTFSFINTKDGSLRGLELEVRSSLGFIGGRDADGAPLPSVWQNLTPFLNASLIRSSITSPFDGFKRPLQGQSPYTINAGASYQHPKTGLQTTVTVNRTGTRLAFVGDSYVSGIWERPRTVLDASVSYVRKRWTLKGTLGDLLAQDQVFFVLYGPGLSPTDPNARRDFLGTPVYKEGVDIPFFQFTYGRTIRLTVTYAL